MDHYPEKLGVVFLVDTPVLFRAFWKVAKTMVDEKTVKKVVFVTGEDGRKKAFPLHFDMDQVETCFCGKNPYHYHHNNYYRMLRKEEAENITILTQPEGSDIPIDEQIPTKADEEEEELVNPDEPTPKEDRRTGEKEN